MQSVIERGAIDEVSRKEILDLVRRNGCLDKARELSPRATRRKAQQCLEVVPDRRHKDALMALTYYVIERNR